MTRLWLDLCRSAASWGTSPDVGVASGRSEAESAVKRPRLATSPVHHPGSYLATCRSYCPLQWGQSCGGKRPDVIGCEDDRHQDHARRVGAASTLVQPARRPPVATA